MIHVDPALVAPGEPPTAASAPDAPAPARALIERQLGWLTRLAEIGMEIAEAVGRRAAADHADADPTDAHARRDPGLVFARVARAVRMTIALQSRLAHDLAALDRTDRLAEAARADRRRMRLRRLVEDAARASLDARRAAESPSDAWGRSDDEEAVEDEIERLSDEACERLTDAEDGDLPGLPFDEVVAGICKDLGLSPDWTARLLAAAQPPPGRSADAPGAARPLPPAARPPDPERPPPDLAFARPAAPPRAPP